MTLIRILGNVNQQTEEILLIVVWTQQLNVVQDMVPILSPLEHQVWIQQIHSYVNIEMQSLYQEYKVEDILDDCHGHVNHLTTAKALHVMVTYHVYIY